VLLSFFPQKYRAAVTLTPVDPSSLGLSGQNNMGMGSLLGGSASLLGNQTAVDVNMTVARSEYVRSIVAKRLHLDQRLGKSEVSTHRWLARKVDIGSLRGGIIQFETQQRDANLARALVAAYADATRQQLAIISRDQTAQKRQIIVDLVTQASDNLAKAQAAYDTFRLQTRYSSPTSALFAAGDRIPVLESMVRSKKVELAAAHQFATDNEPRIRQMTAAINALEQQLDDARSTSPAEKSSVGQVVSQSTEADRLRRKLITAQILYDNYERYLQNTSAEDMTANANMRILEPAYIDSARQVNFIPAMLGVILLLAALGVEFYMIRPPVGQTASA
jgi:hypothetical protein